MFLEELGGDDCQWTFVRGGGLEVIEVLGRQVLTQIEVVSVGKGTSTHPFQSHLAWCCQVDGLGFDAQRPQQLAVLRTKLTQHRNDWRDTVAARARRSHPLRLRVLASAQKFLDRLLNQSA